MLVRTQGQSRIFREGVAIEIRSQTSSETSQGGEGGATPSTLPLNLPLEL